jgi:hypothetical protein
MEFSPIVPDYIAKLSVALDMIPALEAWIESVRSLAYAEAERGNTPNNYKLVAKKGSRQWLDPTAAQKALSAVIPLTDLFSEPEFLSPAQVEKKLGKENKKLVEPLVSVVSSGNTLVHVSDKRPPVKLITAQDEFKIQPA